MRLDRIEVADGKQGGVAFSYRLPETWRSKGTIHHFPGNPITPVVGELSFENNAATYSGRILIPLSGRFDFLNPATAFGSMRTADVSIGAARSFHFIGDKPASSRPPGDVCQWLYSRWKLSHPGVVSRVTDRSTGPLEKSNFFGAGEWHSFSRLGIVKVSYRIGRFERVDTLVANLDWIQLGDARAPMEKGCQGAWLFSLMGSFSQVADDVAAADGPLAAAVLETAKPSGRFFVKCASLRQAALGFAAKSDRNVDARGDPMDPGLRDAYFDSHNRSFESYLRYVHNSNRIVSYWFNNDYLNLPEEFADVWGGPNGAVRIWDEGSQGSSCDCST